MFLPIFIAIAVILAGFGTSMLKSDFADKIIPGDPVVKPWEQITQDFRPEKRRTDQEKKVDDIITGNGRYKPWEFQIEEPLKVNPEQPLKVEPKAETPKNESEPMIVFHPESEWPVEKDHDQDGVPNIVDKDWYKKEGLKPVMPASTQTAR